MVLQGLQLQWIDVAVGKIYTIHLYVSGFSNLLFIYVLRISHDPRLRLVLGLGPGQELGPGLVSLCSFFGPKVKVPVSVFGVERVLHKVGSGPGYGPGYGPGPVSFYLGHDHRSGPSGKLVVRLIPDLGKNRQ